MSQQVLGLLVDGVDNTAEEPSGEENLVRIADQIVEVVSSVDVTVAARGGARFPVAVIMMGL